ncbi:hypothetical protein [Microcoleus sp.]
MPYALCPMPYARWVPHVTEKGYMICLLKHNNKPRNSLPLPHQNR